MKTKDLIKQLQEVDPTGENEVTVGNVDITSVHTAPTYYDGCQEILIRDPNSPHRIVGAKYRSGGSKVVIVILPIEDAIYDKPDFSVDFSELHPTAFERYSKDVARWRKQSLELRYEAEMEHFRSYVLRFLPEIQDNHQWNLYKDQAKAFFDKHLSWSDPLPPELRSRSDISWYKRREMQWDQQIAVFWSEKRGLQIEKRINYALSQEIELNNANIDVFKQASFHPLTCGGNRHDAAHKKYAEEHGDSDLGVLIKTENGLICPVCGYTQN